MHKVQRRREKGREIRRESEKYIQHIDSNAWDKLKLSPQISTALKR